MEALGAEPLPCDSDPLKGESGQPGEGSSPRVQAWFLQMGKCSDAGVRRSWASEAGSVGLADELDVGSERRSGEDRGGAGVSGLVCLVVAVVRIADREVKF